jgi:signal transduction histidine kinase/ActR/RegA family two-component response regulator
VGETVALDKLVSPADGQAQPSPFDGEPRIMAYAQAGTAPDIFVVAVGMARDAAFAEVDRSSQRMVLLILLSLLLALLAAWLVGRYGLQRPIFVLNHAARRWAAGDYSARTGLAGRSELHQLAQTFDRMAEALQVRDRERVDYEQQLRRSRDEAVEANEAKTRFLAAASHDLRQPLQALSMGVTVLEEKHRGDEQASIMVARIKRSVQSLTDLLNSLLDIAALESGLITPQVTDFSLKRLLEELRDEFGQPASTKGLSYRVDECGATVRSDPQHLGRMLRNLVDNAVKFTPAGGEVHVHCLAGEERVEIVVSDTGIGVSPDQQRAIFQDFKQLNNPERSRTKGLGLGLAVVERMSRLLDHPVRLESVPGKGSKFVIAVPRAPHPVGDEFAGQPARADGRVLLVEDDPLVAEATMELLKSWGARVELARTAEEAIALIGRSRDEFQVVIADYRLPAASGLDVVANAILRWPRIKAAIITGDRESVSHEKIIAEGVHLLEKPIRASQLAALLDTGSAVERV